jgi:hypothetical protein
MEHGSSASSTSSARTPAMGNFVFPKVLTGVLSVTILGVGACDQPGRESDTHIARRPPAGSRTHTLHGARFAAARR